MLTPRPRVAVLYSRRCPGLRSLLAGHRRREFDLACVLTTSAEGVTALPELGAWRVPVLVHPLRPYARMRGVSVGNLAARQDYDRRTRTLLEPHRPDVVLLSSYLYVLTAPMLEAFPGRIVNVHGSDLARRGPGGRPLYPGLHAVRDAIRAGEPETRATAHVVTDRLDDGPILMRSRPFPVADFVAELRREGNGHAVNAYAHAHQEWMLATAWGPLLTGAIARVAAGRAAALPSFEARTALLAAAAGGGS